MDQMGIKESLELLEGLKVLGLSGKKIMADGKVSAADLGELMSLASNLGVLADAFKGAGEIKNEMKDLSPEEIQQLGLKALEVISAIRAA